MPKKSEDAPPPTMSKMQFFEKMEALRERLVAEAKKLGLTMQTLKGVFPEPMGVKPADNIPYADFKKRLLSLGFNLTGLSDGDLLVLDPDDSKTISPKDFLAFFALGLEIEETAKKEEAPPPPVDDLAFKAADMEGVLSVRVSEARSLREAQAWFSALKDAGANDAVNPLQASALPKPRKLVRYDAAQRAGLPARQAKIGARLKAEREALMTKAAARQAKLLQASPADPAAELAQSLVTSDLFASPIGRRQGGGNTPRDDVRSVRSALGDLLSSAGEMAALKLHGDKDLQEAEKRRTRDLKALRTARQSQAAEDRTAEIQEAGALRKKTALALKVDRRMLTRDQAALVLLGLDASALRAKPWYAPHKDDKDSVQAGVRPDRAAQPSVSKIALPCGCTFRTMGVLPFLRSKNACPSCGVSFNASPGSLALGDAAKPASEAKVDTLAVQAVAVTPGNPSRGPTQFTLFRYADYMPAPAPAAIAVAAPGVPAPDAATQALAGGTPAASPLGEVEVKVVFGELDKGPGRIALVDARDNRVVVFDYNKADADATAATPKAPTHSAELEGSPGDLWDNIIERVSTIAESRGRGKESTMNASIRALERGVGRITKDDFKVFSRVVSAIPSPSTTKAANASRPQAVKLGTAPTPKNLKKTPGTASVMLQRNAAALHADMLSVANSAQLKQLEAERYDEVFRRLVSVPTVYLNELDGERGSASVPSTGKNQVSHLCAFARALFDKMDANANGSISLDEFKLALTGMNIDISQDDALTLFNRFERKADGMIDWDEFAHFFQAHIASDLSTEALDQTFVQTRPMRHVLVALHKPLHAAHVEMTKLGLRSVEAYTQAREGKPQEPAALPFVLPDNAILHRLDESTSAANVTTLRLLGAHLSVAEMHRVNFVFKNDVRLFIAFAAAEEMRLGAATISAIQTIIRCLKTRAGDRPVDAGRDEMTNDNVVRLWALIAAFAAKGDKYPAAGDSSIVPMAALADFLEQMVLESRVAKAPPPPPADAIPAIVPPAAPSLRPDPKDAALIGGVAVNTLCRIVVDGLHHSSWNRSIDGGVSFSAFESFVREGHVNSIERKLRYLLELELSLAGPATLALVHVYVNESKSEAVVLVHEPLMGTVYKMVVAEDLSALPSDPEALKALFPWADETRARARGSNPRVQHTLYPKILNDASFALFNPTETPDEDAAVSELVQRLRIIKGANAAKIDTDKRLILAEDPRFVAQLKKLLDSVPSLPFFCNCNDTNLYFDTDRDTLAAEGSIRRLVFGNIRLYKPLHAFLVSVISELRVVLSSYNSGVKVCMPWCEMLAHLTEYRNPYVSVELKPRFLEPHEYIYRPEDRREAFTGTEEADALAVQRSDIVVDGGSHPVFNAQFKIQFRPPKLTSCKLVSTEIHKMEIEGELKYVILMAREAKRDRSSERLLMRDAKGNVLLTELESGSQNRYHKLPDRLEAFRFLTIYDPRTATDYQCGVVPGCELFDDLMEPPPDGGESEAALDKLKEAFDAMGPRNGLLSFDAVEAAMCRDQLAAIRQETEKALQARAEDGLFSFRAFLELAGKLAPEFIPDDKVLQSKDALDKACRANKDLDRQRIKFEVDLGGFWLDAAKKDPTAAPGTGGAAAGAPEVTGKTAALIAVAGGAAPGATPLAVPQRLVLLLEDSRGRLFDALSKGKMGLVTDAALKRITAADTNGDGSISFVEYARMQGKQVGHNSGRYDPHPEGICSPQDFMSHVEDAAALDLILLGPAITPRLLVTVVNARGKQEEMLGSCQVSISSVLSGSGVGREQWTKLSHMVPNEANPKLPDRPVPAGAVAVELGFRKQAEIDAEIDAERERRERLKLKTPRNTPKNTPRQAASKAITLNPPIPLATPVTAVASAVVVPVPVLAAADAAALEAATNPNPNPADAAALEAAKAEAIKLAAQVKEESRKREELARELVVERSKLSAAEDRLKVAAEASASAVKGGVAGVGAGAGPSPELLKELEELRALKKKMAADDAHKAAHAAVQAKQIAELEGKLRASKEAVAGIKESPALVHAPASAVKESAAAPKRGKGDKERKDAATEEEPVSLGLSGSAFTGSKGEKGDRGDRSDKLPSPTRSGQGGSKETKEPQPQRPSSAAPSSSGRPGAVPVPRSPVQRAWVDWNTAPLPAGWDRKMDAASGKVWSR